MFPTAVYDYPSDDLPTPIWLRQFPCVPRMMTANFRTLKGLYQPKRKGLKALCDTVGALQGDRQKLLVADEFLATTSRNRDAHAYVPNGRAQHHVLVRGLFADCFNLLVSWLPGGLPTLNTWRDEAAEFVRSLSD